MKPHHGRIPATLTEKDFNEFVFPLLITGRRGPKPKIPSHKIFNYILYLIHTGCQWYMLPIDKSESGHPEISHTVSDRRSAYLLNIYFTSLHR